jgi:hypothetical protein
MKNRLQQVKWIDLSTVKDVRGRLTALESGQTIPIDIKRIFYMHHVEKDRGGHAHINTDQVIIGISGTFSVTLTDGIDTKKYDFADPEKGLYVPSLIYTELFNFSERAVCLVLANTHYDMKMSLRDWPSYLSFIQNEN